MRKRLAVAAAMTAAFAFGIVGTASAQGSTCPTNDERLAATSEPISITTPGWTVAGSLPILGYGQANVDTATIGYSGTLNGPAVGYGDVDGKVIGDGGTPSGSADGELDGVVAGSGSLSGTTLKIQTKTAAGCISISTP